MTRINIHSEHFPSLEGLVEASWAPILLEPIAGSYDRLVVGIAVANSSDFYLEMANGLEKLQCFYGDGAEVFKIAINIAAEHINDELAMRGVEVLQRYSSEVTSISIGECRTAQGNSLKEIAQNWLRSLSSLYSTSELQMLTTVQEADISRNAADRLPFLICNYVGERQKRLLNYFSSDLKNNRNRRRSGRSHEIVIDFSGPKLVANFGALKPTNLSRSTNFIKQRMWDLKVVRDRELQSHLSQLHEMIIQKPTQDDAQVTDKQMKKMEEALSELEAQANQEKLRLRALNDVSGIGQHLLQAEAA